MAKAIIKAALLAGILFVSFRYVAAFSLAQSLVLCALALVVCWSVEELLHPPPELVPFRLRISPNWQALLLDFGPVGRGEGAPLLRMQEALRESMRRNPEDREDDLDELRVQEALLEGLRDRLRADGAQPTPGFYLLRDAIEATVLKPGLVYQDIYRRFTSRLNLEESTLTDETGFHSVYVRTWGPRLPALSDFKRLGLVGPLEWWRACRDPGSSLPSLEIGLIGRLKWWESVCTANKDRGGVSVLELWPGRAVDIDEMAGTASVCVAFIPWKEFLPYWRARRGREGGRASLEWKLLQQVQARSESGWKEESFEPIPGLDVTCIKHKYFTVEHWSI